MDRILEVARVSGVSPLTMGCARLGAFWQGRSVKEGYRAVRTATREGITTFDTADVYARGLSERILGYALAQDRETTFLCTKVGQVKSPANALAAVRYGHPTDVRLLMGGLKKTDVGDSAALGVPRCWSKRYLMWSTESSLRRLRVNEVDLLLLHGPTEDALQSDEMAEGARALLESGKTVRVGVSCDNLDVASTAVRLPWVGAIQISLAGAARDAVEPLFKAAAERDLLTFARGTMSQDRSAVSVGSQQRHLVAADLERRLRNSLSLAGLSSLVIGLSSQHHVLTAADAVRAAKISPA